jgi:hypothetical protein
MAPYLPCSARNKANIKLQARVVLSGCSGGWRPAGNAAGGKNGPRLGREYSAAAGAVIGQTRCLWPQAPIASSQPRFHFGNSFGLCNKRWQDSFQAASNASGDDFLVRVFTDEREKKTTIIQFGME